MSKRLTEYPSYGENPYDLDKDAKYFTTSYVPDGSVVTEDGEFVSEKLRSFIKDNKPFIKLYKEALPVIEGVRSIKAIRVLMRMLDDLKDGEDEVMIHAPTYTKYFGLSNTRDVNEGIKELLEHDIISRKTEAHHYFLNVRLLFNGDRAKYNQQRLK